MSRMIEIQMDSDDMVQALVDRVGAWTDDYEVIDLFEQYYENAVEGGCFDGCEFDVMSIVDNDYVNNTSIMTREEFDKAREKYIEEYLDLDGFTEDSLDEGETLEDLQKQREEARAEYEENTPEWEDVKNYRDIPDFLDVGHIEAMTDNLMLVTY